MMFRTLICLISCLLLNSVSAQSLDFFGVGRESIFRFQPDNDSLTVEHVFQDEQDGENPISRLLELPNGKFYGVTQKGGEFGVGSIFEFDPTTSLTKTITSFNNNNGRFPNSKLVSVNNKIYGITSSGGSSSAYGVIFMYDLASNQLKNIFDFDNETGLSNGHLTLYNNILYGITTGGGENKSGYIYSIDPETDLITKKFDFAPYPEGYLHGGFTETDSLLYVVTTKGGVKGEGCIYGYDPQLNIFKTIYSFDQSSNGGISEPFNLVTPYKNKLYGSANDKFFEFDLLSRNVSKVVNALSFKKGNEFCRLGDSLYCTSGSDLFMWNLNQSSTSILINDFKLYSSKSLIEKNNQLFTVTESVGINSTGSLISISILGLDITKYFDFGGCLNGCKPEGNLFSVNNELYGFTSSGGTKNRGVVYKFKPTDNLYTKLANDDYSTPYEKQTSTLVYLDGKLYGIQKNGGVSGKGAIIEIDLNDNSYKTIHEFINYHYPVNGTDYIPPIGMTKFNGKLYGITPYEREFFNPNIFSFDVNTSDFQIVSGFGNLRGGIANSMIEYNGSLYGVTTAYPDGIIFKLNPTTGVCEKVKDLKWTNGIEHKGLVLLEGKMYGTYYDQVTKVDNLFEYDPLTDSLKKVISFSNQFGGGTLMALPTAYNGELFMTTGVWNGNARILSWKPGQNDFTTRHNNSGYITNPIGSLIIGSAFIGINETERHQDKLNIYPNPTQFKLEITTLNVNGYEIYDLTGRLIQSGALSQIENDIDVSQLISGMYLISVRSVSGKLLSEKFIKE